MLDRIENSMHQLHTMTDSLAHDIRSPMTAVRGKLEASLTARSAEEQTESIVSSIEVLDRLSQFLTTLSMWQKQMPTRSGWLESKFDLEEALISMIDLYQPTLAEKDLTLNFHRAGPVKINADWVSFIG